MKVDLNSDLGEGAGHDDEILSLVSSANIACGFHAGNPASIFNSIRAAKEKGVAVGAHPSLDDRKDFGRTEMQVSAAEVYALVTYQVGAFNALCTTAGVEMTHVKPHGALYNMAVRDRELSDAIAHGVLAVDTRAILFAPAGTELFRAAQELEALLHDPAEAAERVLRMLKEGQIRAVDGTDISVRAETICLHGDTPGAVEFARTLRARLESEGITIAAPEKS